MPPEPAPWERKDFVFKDRKHDRITSGDALASGAFCGGGGNSTPRWRDPYYFSRASPCRPPPSEPSPRRPPPSYQRQTVSYYQLYDESNGHSCTPSRSDDGFRPSNGRYSGGRSSSRESRGSFRRSPYYDAHVTSQRSVAVPITSTPPHTPLKDLHDKNAGGDGQRSYRDPDQDRDRERNSDQSLGSIAWKTLKWSRQGTISSSKAIRSEVEEAASGSLDPSVPNPGKETPVRSPVSSPPPSDDGAPKKKPRLTWGQGLAKYEKQKVGGSSANSGKDLVSETSLKLMGMPGSTSPTTPCSVARSSSPVGAEYRPFSRAINVDNETSEASILGCQNCSEKLPITEDLLSTSVLTSLLNDLLIPEDVCTGDSTANRCTAADKLASFKAGISKELEKTECEIDLLENELKSLNNVGESVACQISVTSHNSSSLPCVEAADKLTKVSSVEEPALHVVCSSGEMPSSDNRKPPSLCNADEVTVDVGETAVTENVSGGANNVDDAENSVNVDLNINPCAKADSDFVDLVLASNRDAAKRSSRVFDGALPTSSEQLEIWGPDRMLLCRRDDMRVREKITLQKQNLKFKERVLALKFRALHHLWKEDLRLLSVKKQRPKSQKRSELCSRALQSSFQKHRSSSRSRFTLPGSTTLVPTADIVEFTGKLLSDTQIRVLRNNLKMPAHILDEKERRNSRFISKNNLVEDPLATEKERSKINPWTKEENGVFMDMLAEYGKDFAKISSFLSHKTTADCIEFYYKNHKSESFRDVKKQLDLRKQRQSLPSNTYLLPASGKMWKRETNAGSLDVANNDTGSQPKHAGKFVLSSGFDRSKLSREDVSNVEISVHESEATAAEMLANISGALSSEAVSSCVTNSISPSEKNYRPLTPGVTQIIEEDTFSDEGCAEADSVGWTDDEKSMFIRALSMYGKDFSRISACVRTKSRDQCKIFFSKARKCLGLDQVHSGAADGATPVSDANGGRSETEDACVAEMDSAICSTQSCSKMDVDFTQSQCVGSVSFEPTSLPIEIGRSGEQNEVGVESVVEVEELENLKLDEIGKEILDVSFNNNEQGPCCDAAELLADRELSIVEAGLPVFPDEPAKLPSVEGGESEGHTSERGSTAEEVLNGVALHPVCASDAGSAGRQRKETVANTFDRIEFSVAAECNTNGDASCSAPNLNVCSNPSFSFATSHQHRVSLESPSSSQHKSQQLLPSLQDNVYPVPLSTLVPDPSSFCFEGSCREPPFNFHDHLRKLQQASTPGDLYEQYLSRISFSQAHSSSHVLSGYPMQILNQKELKIGANMSHSNGNMNSQLDRCFIPGSHIEKVDSSSIQSRPTMLFSRSEDASDSQLRPCSTSSLETNEQMAHRTGDVKLFGQIITNPSSSHKSDPQPPKQKKPAAPLESPSSASNNSSVFVGQSGLEEVPLQSYGFWDGNRIQTGFSSLPTPFVVSCSDGVSATASFQQDYIPALSANGKRVVDNISELQKRNGLELQRAAMARLGNNMVGAAGLSDPVAVLKLVRMYNGEVDSWMRHLNGR